MFSFVEFAVGVEVTGGFLARRIAVNGKHVFQFVAALGYNGFADTDSLDRGHAAACGKRFYFAGEK